jgi:hypothetical protein
MEARKLLVVLLADASASELRRAISERWREPPNVHVVAPTRVGALDWLASDEDAARREADIRALEVEWTLQDRADVQAESGDVDPVLAVEDALRTFPADEILIAGGASENGVLEASLRRLGLPVTRLGGSVPPPAHAQARETARAVVGGRSRLTPFAFFAGVNLTLLAVGAVISALVLLVLWLR